MATAALVNRDIEIGRRIIAALTRASIPVTVYLWAFVPQLEEWQFMVATPLVDTKGPLAAYGEINKVLQKEGIFEDVPLRRIFLRSPNDRVLKSLERQSKSVPNEDFRSVNAPIAGRFVEDAYLYTGSVHVLKGEPPDEYMLVYAPYSGRSAAKPAVVLESIDDVREFLDKKLRIRKDALESALKELNERGGVSIPNIQLKPHDLKRLRLA